MGHHGGAGHAVAGAALRLDRGTAVRDARRRPAVSPCRCGLFEPCSTITRVSFGCLNRESCVKVGFESVFVSFVSFSFQTMMLHWEHYWVVKHMFRMQFISRPGDQSFATAGVKSFTPYRDLHMFGLYIGMG